MLLPALSLQDVEDMSIKEVEQRITFLAKNNQEKQKVDLQILHGIISYGSNATKKNNREFRKYIGRIFNDKEQVQDNEGLDDILDVISHKK